MTDEKYYIPTIEEFHVGFEYEEKLVKYQNPGESKFHKNIVKTPKGIPYEMWLKDGSIRVKKLDKEDIESCGFILDKAKELTKNHIEFKMDNVDYTKLTLFQYMTDTLFLSFNFVENEIHIHNGGIYEDSDSICLRIKNKSELKRVLKQIGL